MAAGDFECFVFNAGDLGLQGLKVSLDTTFVALCSSGCLWGIGLEGLIMIGPKAQIRAFTDLASAVARSLRAF